MDKKPLDKLNEEEIEIFSRGAIIGLFVGVGVTTLASIISIFL